MPIDAVVRVSFNSDVKANPAVNEALVGRKQGDIGSGPSFKLGTAFYSCADQADADVAKAIAALGRALIGHAHSLYHCFLSMVRRPTVPAEAPPANDNN